MKKILLVFTVILICFHSFGQKPRARDLGIPFVGNTEIFSAITDVKGVEVGYSTIISGKGENIIGKGPIRTRFTAMFPRGKAKKFDRTKRLEINRPKRLNKRITSSCSTCKNPHGFSI